MEALNTLANAFVQFFTKSHSFLRFIFVILLIMIFWLLNDSLGFVRGYRNSTKIEQIKKLEEIIQNPKIDSTTKSMLVDIERSIIYRESFLERLYISLFEEKDTQITVKKKAGIEQIPTITKNSFNNDSIYYKVRFLIHTFSSSWLGVLLMFYAFYRLIRHRNTIKLNLSLLLISIINIGLFSIITLLFPKSNYELINYLINALFYSVVQILLIMAILPYIINNKDKILTSLDEKFKD